MKKVPLGRLNTDDNYSILPTEDYQVSKNARIVTGEGASIGAIKNIPGHSQILNQVLKGTSDAYTCIGAYEDARYNRIFFFMYATPSLNHGIFCYRVDEGDILTVFENDQLRQSGVDKGLNWNTLTQITGIGVSGDILYWVDEDNQARCIDVERSIKTVNIGYVSPDGTTPVAYSQNTGFLEEDISVIKRPPSFPLSIVKADSTTDANIDDQDNNYLNGESFQFTYRYVYADDKISTFSSFSEFAFHNNPDDGNSYDTIIVSVPINETIPANARMIQVAVRSGNTGSFSIIKNFTTSDFSTEITDHNNGTSAFSFHFFNDSLGIPVSDEESFTPFHNVPIKSKALEIARNRLFLANNTFGYDPITSLGITASLTSQTSGGSNITGEYIRVYIDCENPSNEQEQYQYNLILIKVDESDPTIDGFYVTSIDPAGWFTDTLPPSVIVSSVDRVLTNLLATDTQIIDAVNTCPTGWDDNSIVDTNYGGSDPTVLGIGSSTSIVDGFRQFKTNGRYKLGIVFYDQYGRNNGVYTNDSMVVSTPERSYTQSTYYTTIGWNISDDGTGIPDWATHYSIVVTKNLLTTAFIQHYSTEIKYVTEDADGNYTYSDTVSDDDVAVAYDISKLAADKLGYVYSEGDILKAYDSGGSDKYTLNVIDQVGKYIFVDAVDMGSLTGAVHLIEVYTPYKASINEEFYEIGQKFPVTLPATSSRDYSVSTGSLMGDVVIKNRDFSGGTVSLEAMNPDDNHWKEWVVNTGRSVIELGNSGQEEKPTNVAYSATFVQGTKVNGLNSFSALDQKDLDGIVGPIRKLVLTSKTQQYGTVMLAIGEHETATMYLGESRLLDNENEVITATSGDVIGTVNTLRGSYGTTNPESVVENDGRVYWVDAKKGEVVRYNLNGLTSISDNKNKELFRYLLNTVYEQNALVQGGYDPISEEYLLCIDQMPVGNEWGYLEDFIETIFDEVVLNLNPNYDIGVTVLPGYRYKITVGAGSHDVFFGGTKVFDGPGDTSPLEYTALERGAVTTNMGVPENVKIEKYKKSPHTMYGESGLYAFKDNVGWTTLYEYVPEKMMIINNKKVAWKSGVTYVHSDDAPVNTWLGEFKKTGIGLVINEGGMTPVYPQAISIEGTHAPSWVHIRIQKDGYVLSTDIEKSEFIYREGSWQAEVKRDRLTPNAPSYEAGLIAGDVISGIYPQIYLEWDDTEAIRIDGISIELDLSSGFRVQQ